MEGNNMEYSVIFEQFKDKITDYDLPQFEAEMQNDILCNIQRKACAKFKRICKSDLSDRDDELMQFNVELSEEEIDILTEWMVNIWLTPLLNNMDNMRNKLSTKDFSMFSPANLLITMQNVHTTSRKRAKSMMNEYSYVNNDFDKLKA
jgi:hypothetical protein